MYNKSKEKITPKPPAPLKPTSANRIPKPNEPVLPAIKPRKESANKPPSVIKPPISSKPSTKKIESASTSSYSLKKGVPAKQQKVGWHSLSLNLLLDVSQFLCETPFEAYRLSLVCSVWRQLMGCENAVYFWRRFKKTQKARSFYQFKQCLQEELQQVKQRRGAQFQSIFTKLFNYGSTKQNIPNKLINRLKLQLTVTINKRTYPNYPFRLRNFNFSSYLYAKMPQLNQVPFDLYTPHNLFKDKLEISLKFYSKTFKVSHAMAFSWKPQQIADCAIHQKAFNYFLEKNLVITFFEGDNAFLYAFLQISVLQLVTYFRKAIRLAHQQHLDRRAKNIPLYKQLCQTQFENFLEYLKYQADFELHMSYHNSVKQIFTHCDTKVYPVEYDQKSAYFDVRIDDTFNRTATFMLDNKMGMAEAIDDLYLLDFILKDRDRFLIVFSGFIYARNASQKERESVQNYFQFAQLPVKLLQYKGEKYNFSIFIIEEPKKNFIKHARFRIYP